ncbi:hypothetical protein [Brenneria goodwinii]|uniref:hypothetical protein n=1 Tax=Brenneria goodwinii TaxID=1109412 RepID=UPI0036F2B96C
MMKAAPCAAEIATSLYVGVFNIGIALGSWTGSRIVDGFGLTTNLRLVGGCAASALAMA